MIISSKCVVSLECTLLKQSRPPTYSRLVQNNLYIWLDNSIDNIDNRDCHNTITKLRQVVNTIYTFTHPTHCINFINHTKNENIILITSCTLGQSITPLLDHISQLEAIYIFCLNKFKHKQWSKVEGVFTDIASICKVLKQTAQDTHQLDQSFMYTRILKDILLTIGIEQKYSLEFVISNNQTDFQKFQQECRCDLPIRWYTYECWLSSMMNQDLCSSVVMDIGIKMGFLIDDLHRHIIQINAQQSGNLYQIQMYIVRYSSKIDF